MRPTAAALLSGALAVAAHSAAGGGLPSAGVVVLLAVLMATLAAVVAAWPRAGNTWVLILLLGATQLIAHLVQTVAGHSHHASSQAPMVAAHVAAVVAGALLIAAAERLRDALSSVLRVCVRLTAPAPRQPRRTQVSWIEPVLVSLTYLTTRSYRGPPAAT